MGAAEVDPYLAAEQVWATGNRNVLDFLASVDPRRHHRIYYEELVREPERIMAGLCEFLGIPFDEAVLKPYEGRRMTDGVHSQSLPIGDPNFMMHDRIEPELSEKWKKISLSRPLAVSTRELAADLEYELPLEPEISPQPLSPLPMRERYVDVRGLGICLCSWGPEDGPLLVLVHGILEHGAAWERVAVPLARLGYHVVAPDLRGHGLSSHVGAGASYHLIDFLADLEVVVREIAETPFTLVGHSMGATVAAMYASIRPERVRTLVLVECLLPQDNDADKALENLATHLNYLVTPVRHAVLPDVAAAANRLRRLTPSMPEETALRMAQRITEPCPRGVQWRWDPLLRTRAGIAFHGTENLNLSRYLEVLGKIQASTTLVYGNTSNAVSAEQVSLQLRKIPRSRQIVLPGGHNLHMDCPEAVAEIIASVADVPKGSDQVGSVSSKS
jgi:pimeloyl-ACP methyl ester carboxylesterase